MITLNSNEGHNQKLMEQCRILREYASDCELNTAVERAVNYCIQNDILAEFLQKNRSEVIATSIFEYDKEEEEKKLRRAEYEAGMEAGMEVGIQKGKLQKAREMAVTLNNSGFPIEKITEFLQVKKETIQEWIKKSAEN